MAPLPYCFCAIALIVVGAFNDASAKPDNQDFQMIMDALQDVAKNVAECRSTNSVLELDEVLRSQYNTSDQLVFCTAYQLPPKSHPVNSELAVQFEEYKNKFKVAEQQIKHLEKRLLQVETTPSQTKEKPQSDEAMFQDLEKKVDEATSNNPCRSPFYEVGDDCIYVNLTVELTWHECRDFCGIFGGDLAVPSDVLKLREFLTSVSEGKNYWIGGSDLKEEGSWLWLDGRQVDLHVGWAKGEPNNSNYGKEHCLHYWSGQLSLLNDAMCTNEDHCVCQDVIYPK